MRGERGVAVIAMLALLALLAPGGSGGVAAPGDPCDSNCSKPAARAGLPSSPGGAAPLPAARAARVLARPLASKPRARGRPARTASAGGGGGGDGGEAPQKAAARPVRRAQAKSTGRETAAGATGAARARTCAAVSTSAKAPRPRARCRAPEGCEKQPSFGDPYERSAKFCVLHRAPEHVCVRGRHCEHLEGCRQRALYLERGVYLCGKHRHVDRAEAQPPDAPVRLAADTVSALALLSTARAACRGAARCDAHARMCVCVYARARAGRPRTTAADWSGAAVLARRLPPPRHFWARGQRQRALLQRTPTP